MRVLATSLAAVVLVLAAGTASATWTDTVVVAPATPALTASALAAPELDCQQQSGVDALISWTPSADPSALTYTAEVVSVSPPRTLATSGSSVAVTRAYATSVLGLSLGGSMTVRVIGHLPGTSWTTSQDIVLRYLSVLTLSVISCPSS